MKKLLNILLILTSLIGYLEWGKDHQMFLFRMEYEIFFHTPDKDAMVHPAVLIPLLGQLILLFTVFQKTPSKALTFIGLISLSVLLLFLFFIGATSGNMKILLSTIPFIVTGILVVRAHRNRKVS